MRSPDRLHLDPGSPAPSARRLPLCLLLLLVAAPLAAGVRVGPLELIGEVDFETGYVFAGTTVGGLSGLSCESGTGHCLAISDDRSENGPARFYTLEVDLADGTLDPGDVRFVAVTTLRDAAGEPFAPRTLDPEGIALAPGGELFVSSEGDARHLVPPFVRRFAADGRQLAELELPHDYLPTAAGDAGVRDNLALESLALTPDGSRLFTATENALVQDGPEADIGVGSPSRLLALDPASGQPVLQYFYWVDAAQPLPVAPGARRGNGLCDLLALDDGRLIALERGYAVGLGNRIRLYLVSLDGAEVLPPHLHGGRIDPRGFRAARKTLLADLDQFGLELDNVEGLSFGPPLPDGRRSLLLVSDNNFSPNQVTQFLAFAVGPLDDRPEPVADPRIHDVQGAGHTSPLTGRRVLRVPGVVTAISRAPGANAFWMEDLQGDGDDATSEGIQVVTGYAEPPVEVGDAVQVDGWVEEAGRPGELTVTRLVRPAVEVTARPALMPRAVVLGAAGRRPPSGTIDDDRLARFEPATDAIDFFESLEGMLVRVPEPLVVGPTSEYGDLVVLADGGAGAERRTPRGGIHLTPESLNPQRIMVSAMPGSALPDADVGDRLDGDLVGVVDYRYGTFRLLPSAPLPALVAGGLTAETTSLVAAPDRLTVATYNVRNLGGDDPDESFARLAATIVVNLGGPDLLALQEVQDDDGPADDGVVSAAATLARLTAAIAAAGGPRYEARQVDPVNDADGGQPGGNIRVALLFNPARLSFVDRGAAGALDATAVEPGPDGPHLTLSPGYVAPAAAAFNRERRVSFGASRKPLAAELRFHGHPLFVVGNHLRSKGGDDYPFGAVQPPLAVSEVQRRDQAATVHGFVESILTLDPAAWVVVLGDLNELDFRPPLERLAGSLLTNLVARLPADDRYSFVHQGNSQLLDHILVSRSLAARAEVDIVHVNAERAASRQASDHDPVVARFRLPDGASDGR